MILQELTYAAMPGGWERVDGVKDEINDAKDKVESDENNEEKNSE